MRGARAGRWGLRIAGAVVAAALAPPVFEPLLAFGPLHPNEVVLGWVGAVLVAGAPWVLRDRGAALGFGLLLLIGVEVGARVAVRDPEARLRQHHLGEQTWPDRQAYVPHPFTQFEPRDALWAAAPTPKADGVRRVICLGGSTTASGWPTDLQEQLGDRWEVLNFGVVGWTSTHSLSNFVLNGLDREPDVVVVHHGWNDFVARDAAPGVFRGDYAHALGGFAVPRPRDRWLLRASALYRLARHGRRDVPPWAILDRAMDRDFEPSDGPAWADLTELEPYRRNLRTLIQLGAANGFAVVLTTLPRAPDAGEFAVPIDQANAVTREVAGAYPETRLLDLAAESWEGFLDAAHIDEAGRRRKAERIAAALLEPAAEDEVPTGEAPPGP